MVELDLGYEADPTTKKMMTMVAELVFRCLQQNGEMRPSIKELEVLRSIQGDCRASTRARRQRRPPPLRRACRRPPPAPSSRSHRQWRRNREGVRLKWWKQASNPSDVWPPPLRRARWQPPLLPWAPPAPSSCNRRQRRGNGEGTEREGDWNGGNRRPIHRTSGS